jgi:uncharacterized protein YvpB
MKQKSAVLITLPFLLILLVGIAFLSAARGRSFAGSSVDTPAPSQTRPYNQPSMTHASSTPILSPTPALTRTISLEPTVEPSLTPTHALPIEHFISAIRGHRQYFPLGCEAAAAKDWANFFGFDFNEFEFQYKIPVSDNPELGFVGDVNSPWGQVPPYGYGVYAGPVADLLNIYGIPAKAYKGYTLEKIKAKVAQDKPVIAWVIGNVVGGVPSEYTDSKGNETIVAAYEHVVIVTGFDESHIRYMTNGKFYDTPNEVFLNSWGVLGNMVIVDK